MATLTTITLTYNEAVNIEECINSFKAIANRVIVLDGNSSDDTVEIARKCGAEVYICEMGYFDRFKYALENIKIDTDWILFIDADERMTSASREELKLLCEEHKNTSINGIVVNYHVEFMGKELHFGASDLHKLRVFKPGSAFMENIKLDQHIRLLQGSSVKMKTYLLHKDYKGLQAWSYKHIRYAGLAAEDYFEKQRGDSSIELNGLETNAKLKRIIKYRLYYKLPFTLRAKLFFIYRYYFRLGFLDGKEGRIFIFLHAYWYRFLVDSLIYEKSNDET